ncbi:hypothetical protein AN641_06785 [Candidatus Epulonipiscioides gigas]|nr:hypothetical protein AN641_06785 [Epulopiscium sp. SCG-C07WGA-EpuloA2]
MGECYENGTGIAQNSKQAVKWYTKAAKQGNVDAQIKLGKSSDDNKKGITKHFKKTFKRSTKEKNSK